MEKLSTRLNALFNLIDTSYDTIWDLCCDHGYLGLSLIEAKRCKRVHFVDCIPSIIQSLKKNIEKVPFETDGQFELLTMDAKKIKLDHSHRNLVIISGLGGRSTIQMIDAIVSNNGKVDFLLSPKHHLFELRTHLASHGFKLKKETITTDNGRHYENLLVSEVGEECLPTGGQQWDFTNESHYKYIQKLISHYKRMGATIEYQSYKKLLSSFIS